MNIIVQEGSFSKSLCFLFSGKAGVGKTYCSQLLEQQIQKLEFSYFRSPFAYGVKDTARYMGWDGEKDDKGRKLLQDIGKIGRRYDKNLWVKQAFARIESDTAYPHSFIIIDDWRFRNEYSYIKNQLPLYKPIRIRVIAPEREILKNTKMYNDVSETELDNAKFDYVISNIEDKGAFEQVKQILYSEIMKNIRS